MTAQQYYSAALGQLTGMRNEIAETKEAVARIDERTRAIACRLGVVERWQETKSLETEQTGRHEVATLRAQVAQMEQARVDERADRRRVMVDFATKAALMALGALLATFMPLIASAFGM